MFVGHTGVALAARSRARGVALGPFMVATFALDLIWPVLLLTGVETVRIVPGATPFTGLEFVSYPWSHSLLMALVWGGTGFLLARWRKVPAPAAWLLGAVVVSHWVLDWITHVPDLPLRPGPSPRLGLGLWRSIPATFLVEGAIFAAGAAMYLKETRARDGIGGAGIWAFLGFSTLVWATLPWSPPPSSPRSLALFSLTGWLLIAWAGWADRHRMGR